MTDSESANRADELTELELRFFYAGDVGDSAEERLWSSSYTADLLTQPGRDAAQAAALYSLAGVKDEGSETEEDESFGNEFPCLPLGEHFERSGANIDFSQGGSGASVVISAAASRKVDVRKISDSQVRVVCEHYAPSLIRGKTRHTSLTVDLVGADTALVEVDFGEHGARRLGLQHEEDVIELSLDFDHSKPVPINIDGKPLELPPWRINVLLNATEIAKLEFNDASDAELTQGDRVRLAVAATAAILCQASVMRILHAAYLSLLAFAVPLDRGDPVEQNAAEGAENLFNSVVGELFAGYEHEIVGKTLDTFKLDDLAREFGDEFAEALMDDSELAADAGDTLFRIGGQKSTLQSTSEKRIKQQLDDWAVNQRQANNGVRDSLDSLREQDGLSDQQRMLMTNSVMDAARTAVDELRNFPIDERKATDEHKALRDAARENFRDAFNRWTAMLIALQVAAIEFTGTATSRALVRAFREKVVSDDDNVAALYILAAADTEVPRIGDIRLDPQSLVTLRLAIGDAIATLRSTGNRFDLFKWKRSAVRFMRILSNDSLWADAAAQRDAVVQRAGELMPLLISEMLLGSGVAIEMSQQIYTLLKRSAEEWVKLHNDLNDAAVKVDEDGAPVDPRGQQTVLQLLETAKRAHAEIEAMGRGAFNGTVPTLGLSVQVATELRQRIPRLLMSLGATPIAGDVFDFAAADVEVIFADAVTTLRLALSYVDALLKLYGGEDEDAVREAVLEARASLREQSSQTRTKFALELLADRQARASLTAAVDAVAQRATAMDEFVVGADRRGVGGGLASGDIDEALRTIVQSLRALGVTSTPDETIETAARGLSALSANFAQTAEAIALRLSAQTFARPVARLLIMGVKAGIDDAIGALDLLRLQREQLSPAAYEAARAARLEVQLARQRTNGTAAWEELLRLSVRIFGIEDEREENTVYRDFVQYRDFIQGFIGTADFVGYVPMPAADLLIERDADVQRDIAANLALFVSRQEEYYVAIRPQPFGFLPGAAGPFVRQVKLREGAKRRFVDIVGVFEEQFGVTPDEQLRDIVGDALDGTMDVDRLEGRGADFVARQRELLTEAIALRALVGGEQEATDIRRELVAGTSKLAVSVANYFKDLDSDQLLTDDDAALGDFKNRHLAIIRFEVLLYEWRRGSILNSGEIERPPSRGSLQTRGELDRLLNDIDIGAMINSAGGMLQMGALLDMNVDDDSTAAEIRAEHARFVEELRGMSIGDLVQSKSGIEKLVTVSRANAVLISSEASEALHAATSLIDFRNDVAAAKTTAQRLGKLADEPIGAETAQVPSVLAAARQHEVDVGTGLAMLDLSMFGRAPIARDAMRTAAESMLRALRISSSGQFAARDQDLADDVFATLRSKRLAVVAAAATSAQADISTALEEVSDRIKDAKKLDQTARTAIRNVATLRAEVLNAVRGDGSHDADSLKALSSRLAAVESEVVIITDTTKRVTAVATAYAKATAAMGAADARLNLIEDGDEDGNTVEQIIDNLNERLLPLEMSVGAIAEKTKRVTAASKSLGKAFETFAGANTAIEALTADPNFEKLFFVDVNGVYQVRQGMEESARMFQRQAKTIESASKQFAKAAEKGQLALDSFDEAERRLGAASAKLSGLLDDKGSMAEQLDMVRGAQESAAELSRESEKFIKATKTVEKALENFEKAKFELEITIPDIQKTNADATEQLAALDRQAKLVAAGMKSKVLAAQRSAKPVFDAKRELDKVVDTVAVALVGQTKSASFDSVAREISVLASGISALLLANRITVSVLGGAILNPDGASSGDGEGFNALGRTGQGGEAQPVDDDTSIGGRGKTRKREPQDSDGAPFTPLNPPGSTPVVDAPSFVVKTE